MELCGEHMNKCKISVAICTFNGEKYISDQLNSLLNQSRVPDEIIISDDGSTDNSVKAISKIMSASVVPWQLSVNTETLGVTKNFEKALCLCSGDIIFTCDQDDVWLEEKIEKYISTFEENPDCQLLFSNAKLVDAQLDNLNQSLWESIKYFQQVECQLDSSQFADLLLKQNVITGATMAFRRQLLDRVIPISDRWLHDYWIGIIATLTGSVIGIPDQLILYRQHDKNVIGAKKAESFTSALSKFAYSENRYKTAETWFDRINDLNDYIRKHDLKLTEDKILKIINCSNFWKRRIELKNTRLLKALSMIFVDIMNGGYIKYYTGIKGATRDVLCLLQGEK